MAFYKNPPIMYKLGYTRTGNADDRHSVAYHKMCRLRGVPLGQDYEVDTKWSAWVTLEEALRLEESYKKEINRNCWADEDYNGLSECRVLTVPQYEKIRDRLYKMFPKSKYGYKQGRVKIYFQIFTKRQPKVK